MSAAILYQTINDLLPISQQLTLRNTFLALLEDESALVRRVATNALPKYLINSNNMEAVNDLLPIFKRIANDDQDSVRIQISPVCATFVTLL